MNLRLKSKILKRIFAEEKKHELNADGFLKIVRKYSKIEELTLDILQGLIDKIVVHHREEVNNRTYRNSQNVKTRAKKPYKEFWAKKRRANCLKQLHSSKKDNHKKTKSLMVIQHGADNRI